MRGKEAPKLLYVIRTPWGVKSYSTVGTMCAAMKYHHAVDIECHIYQNFGHISGTELQTIIAAAPRSGRKRPQRIAEALRFQVLLSALKRGEMDS